MPLEISTLLRTLIVTHLQLFVIPMSYNCGIRQSEPLEYSFYHSMEADALAAVFSSAMLSRFLHHGSTDCKHWPSLDIVEDNTEFSGIATNA